MRYLTLGVSVLFSVSLFASPGMPKQARFVFSPAEAETVVDLDDLDLSGFQVTKCLNLLDVKTGKETTSISTGMAYSGKSRVITVGKQQYELVADSGRFAFGTVGCVLDMKNIRSMQFRLQNTRIEENTMTMQFELGSNPYKDVASIIQSGVAYRGKILSYY